VTEQTTEIVQKTEIVEDFIDRCPPVAAALGQLAEAVGASTPFTDRETRLLKIALAVGAGHRTAIQNLVFKGLAKELTEEEVRGIMLLAVISSGCPAALTGWRIVDDVVAGEAGRIH
jgi:alkylhydroperoxidase/carboxymuconolactone decarboxylase family protein YurZ